MWNDPRPLIIEDGALLDALLREWNSDKVSAKIVFHPPLDCWVTEWFDDGGGHSGAIWARRSPVDPPVFNRARELGYVVGAPKLGYTSDTEFILTENPYILEEIHRLTKEWREKDLANQKARYRAKHPELETD
ncbi:MAG: hypothetical protein JWN37_708 [Candidatus Nomurabacteria bacterium]|nr:hypothetical protein [Candidatus Nomurabacteria bacterium]